jgi:hypothetical protein
MQRNTQVKIMDVQNAFGLDISSLEMPELTTTLFT